ncbi:hypothetical protein Pan216_15680 [Planctomycetes bacterium Pan216]|uniref:3-keto-alpha-glucoside-1,2-lyase/3-keto-2-hydroxy-glucal hydratase domain-containing protein n=1 Tax=Kolteria novifilia TaxID=2527975 RepID=A0A518B168_9BACT|nr:hypothetical protein Pan216_15680 [Planctomycetes bacterium Pan216]
MRVVLLFVAFSVAICETNWAWAQSKGEATGPAFSEQEIRDGWILLFDGKTTFGWESGSAGDLTVVDGALRTGGGAPLVNRPTFAKAQLSLDVKGRGEVFLWNVLDSPTEEGMAKGLRIEFDSRKEWQTIAIQAGGGPSKVAVGKKSMDVATTPAAWRLVLSGKKGASFRDIKLKPVDMTSLFNGKDLTGWRKVEQPSPKGERLLAQRWLVKDGLLHTDVPPIDGVTKGGRGYLETVTLHDNFLLQLDVRTNGKHLNSGVFFRNQPKIPAIGYEAQIRHQWEGDDRTKPVDYGTGGIYRRVPTRRVVGDDMTFVTMTVLAHGRYVGVWVEGQQVSSWTDPRPENANPRLGYSGSAGTISLQCHDPTTDIDFRSLRIAPIPIAK